MHSLCLQLIGLAKNTMWAILKLCKKKLFNYSLLKDFQVSLYCFIPGSLFLSSSICRRSSRRLSYYEIFLLNPSICLGTHVRQHSYRVFINSKIFAKSTGVRGPRCQCQLWLRSLNGSLGASVNLSMYIKLLMWKRLMVLPNS